MSRGRIRSREILRVEIVDEYDDLDPILEVWDALAVAANRPWCTPAWSLAWWRHARSGDARLRVVVAADGDQVVGIGPCFAQVGSFGFVEYRFLGAGNFHRLQPLAEPGREQEVARAIGTALASADPKPTSLVLEGFDASSSWPGAIRAGWPARIQPYLRRDLILPAPVLRLSGSGDDWLATRSTNFRQQLGRRRRNLERAGARARFVEDPVDLARDLGVLFALHHDRWSDRGGSAALPPSIEATLRDAATGSRTPGRARLWMLETEEEPIAAQLFATAGNGVAYWGGGLAQRWEQHAPGIDLHAREIQLASERGSTHIDFGGGDQTYKRRLADHDEPVVWQTMFPISAKYPVTRARLAPKHLRVAARSAARRLSPTAQQRLKRILRK